MLRSLALVLLLIGCNADGTLNKQMVIDVTCDTDAELQPLAIQIVLPVAPPAGAADALLVHPAVVAACKAYHSKPVSVAVVPPEPATLVVPPAKP